MPINFADVQRSAVHTRALLGSQFAGVPALRTPGQVTLLEEEKIMAYFGAGSLYATPQRQEPLV
jgi:photosynthetic reaction center H subunit